MPTIRTFYDELGVARNASSAEIKQKFKEFAKQYHPDKNPPEKQAWAHEQMSRMNFILETLLNPKTREEYDGLVAKYEAIPLDRGPRLSRKAQNALEREYAQVSVEIMNLAGKYSNCRLKMMIGSIVGGTGGLLHLLLYTSTFGYIVDLVPILFAFSYFFALIGVVLLIMGLADYWGRSEYQRRIDELEARRSVLRRRMYEAFASY